MGSAPATVRFWDAASRIRYQAPENRGMSVPDARCTCGGSITIVAVALVAPLTIAYQFAHSANLDPTLSPNGQEMIFISVVGGRQQLMRRPIAGGPALPRFGERCE